MIKIEIHSAAFRVNEGVSMKSGKPKPYKRASQVIYAFTMDRDGKPNPYPEKGEITLPMDRNTNEPIPYQPGTYTLHPSSFFIGDFGAISVAPKLQPVAAKA
ncbi:MAG: single-stranded DNA-binding protein [Variovorax sp.]